METKIGELGGPGEYKNSRGRETSKAVGLVERVWIHEGTGNFKNVRPELHSYWTGPAKHDNPQNCDNVETF